MVPAGLRNALLSAPLVLGAVGCAMPDGWSPLALVDPNYGTRQMDPDRLVALGQLLEQQGRVAQARELYAEALLADAKHAQATERLQYIAEYEQQHGKLPPIVRQTDKPQFTRPPQPAWKLAELQELAPAQRPTDPNVSQDAVSPTAAVPSRPAVAAWEQPVDEVVATVTSVDSIPPSDHRPGSEFKTPVLENHSETIVLTAADMSAHGDWRAYRELQLIEPAIVMNATARDTVATWNRVRVLLKQLENSNADERKSATAELGRLGSRARIAVPAISVLLNDNSPQVRIYAARALWQIDRNAEVVLPTLLKVLESSDATSTCMAAYSLGQMQHYADASLPLLHQRMADGNPLVRVHVAEAICRITPYDDSARRVLVEGLRDTDADIRWVAACGLEATAIVPDPRIVDSLTDALQDSDARVRATAALTLGAFGQSARAAVPALQSVLNAEDHRVRRAALTALEHIHTPEEKTGATF